MVARSGTGFGAIAVAGVSGTGFGAFVNLLLLRLSLLLFRSTLFLFFFFRPPPPPTSSVVKTIPLFMYPPIALVPVAVVVSAVVTPFPK